MFHMLYFLHDTRLSHASHLCLISERAKLIIALTASAMSGLFGRRLQLLANADEALKTADKATPR